MSTGGTLPTTGLHFKALIESCSKWAAVMECEKAICDYVGRFAVGKCEPVTPVVLNAVECHSQVLPQKVGALFESIKVYHSLLQTHDQVAAGQCIGVLQCSAVLRSCEAISPQVAALKHYLPSRTALIEQFSTKFSDATKRNDISA